MPDTKPLNLTCIAKCGLSGVRDSRSFSSRIASFLLYGGDVHIPPPAPLSSSRPRDYSILDSLSDTFDVCGRSGGSNFSTINVGVGSAMVTRMSFENVRAFDPKLLRQISNCWFLLT